MWRRLRIWSHLLNKSLMENFVFNAVIQLTTPRKISWFYIISWCRSFVEKQRKASVSKLCQNRAFPKNYVKLRYFTQCYLVDIENIQILNVLLYFIDFFSIVSKTKKNPSNCVLKSSSMFFSFVFFRLSLIHSTCAM